MKPSDVLPLQPRPFPSHRMAIRPAGGLILVSPDAQRITSSSAPSRTWRSWILGAELRDAPDQLERSSPGPGGGGSWVAQLSRLARARQPIPVHGGGGSRVVQPLP